SQSSPPVLAKLPLAEAKKFWSFQPPRNYPPPTVTHTDWPHTPIDAFILATLEEIGLTPPPPPDRPTLIRPAAFDLTGLPPAADRVPPEQKTQHLAAMGFLTVGRRFLGSQADIIDDRLDVIFRGTQGMTVACARCHDHKFDPIPTADYYSLYGVFASSTEPKDLPLVAEPEPTPEYQAFQGRLQELEQAVADFRTKNKKELDSKNRAFRD